MFRSSSELAVTSSKTAVKQGVVDTPYTCHLCGGHFESGGHPYKQGVKFNNQADTKATKVICPYCDVVTTGSQYILQYKNALYSEEYGATKINKDIDIATFLTFPPTPPFVVHYGMIKQQHLVWRTPISLGQELFTFRLGDHCGQVDRVKLMSTTQAYKEAISALNTWRTRETSSGKKSKVKPIPSLFACKTSAIRSMDDTNAALFNVVTLKFIDENLDDEDDFIKETVAKLQQAMHLLHQLNYLELWLLLPLTKFTDIELKAHKRTLYMA
jgi:CRISPR type IV-associated protein Csf1